MLVNAITSQTNLYENRKLWPKVKTRTERKKTGKIPKIIKVKMKMKKRQEAEGQTSQKNIQKKAKKLRKKTKQNKRN